MIQKHFKLVAGGRFKTYFTRVHFGEGCNERDIKVIDKDDDAIVIEANKILSYDA